MLLLHVGDDKVAQFGRHLRPHAEPALEAGNRLVQQHAEPVDGLQAARRRGGKQRRLQRHIDDVGDDRMVGQAASGSAGKLAVAMHAERGGVHQQVGIAKQFRQRVERDAPKRRAETMRQFHGALDRAVDDADIARCRAASSA